MTAISLDLPAGVVAVAPGAAAPRDVLGQWWTRLCSDLAGVGADLVAVGRLPHGPVVVLTVVHRPELAHHDDVEDTVGALAAELGTAGPWSRQPSSTAFGAGVLLAGRLVAEHERGDGSVSGGPLDVAQVLGPGAGEHSLLVLTAVSPAGSAPELAAWLQDLARTARAVGEDGPRG